MKIIDDFFIKKTLKKLSVQHEIINIQNKLANVNNVFIILNEQFENIKYILTIKQTLKKHYSDSDIYFMPLRFHSIYREILKNNVYDLYIPRPTKFKELAIVERVKKQHKKIDVLIDFSTIDYRYRLMVKRILNPEIVLSHYNRNLVNDYNILVKSNGNTMNFFSMMNMDIVNTDIVNFLRKQLNSINTQIFDYVLIGNGFGIKRKISKIIRDNHSYLHIDDLYEKINIFNIKNILNAKEIICEKKYTDLLDFIKKIT